jgi:hypothetical protein
VGFIWGVFDSECMHLKWCVCTKIVCKQQHDRMSCIFFSHLHRFDQADEVLTVAQCGRAGP